VAGGSVLTRASAGSFASRIAWATWSSRLAVWISRSVATVGRSRSRMIAPASAASGRARSLRSATSAARFLSERQSARHRISAAKGAVIDALCDTSFARAPGLGPATLMPPSSVTLAFVVRLMACLAAPVWHARGEGRRFAVGFAAASGRQRRDPIRDCLEPWPYDRGQHRQAPDSGLAQFFEPLVAYSRGRWRVAPSPPAPLQAERWARAWRARRTARRLRGGGRCAALSNRRRPGDRAIS